MSNFKPLVFKAPVSIADYPKAEGSFKIPDIVQDSYSDKEKAEKSRLVKFQEEVDTKVEQMLLKIKEEAYREGFEQGKKDSFDELENQRLEILKKFEEEMSEAILSIQNQRSIVLEKNMNFFFELIGTISQKVIHKYVDAQDEALGSWLIKICDELSASEEITIHSSEKLISVIDKSLNYLKKHRNSFPHINLISDQTDDRLIVETKKIEIDETFKNQVGQIVDAIKF